MEGVKIMKKYYVDFGTEKFGNRYNLFYTAANESVSKTAERITRKQAIAYVRAERQRRKDDPAFSGYADTYIFPFSWRGDPSAYLPDMCDSSGVVVVR